LGSLKGWNDRVVLVFSQRLTTDDFLKVLNSSRAVQVRGGNGNPGQQEKPGMQTK
jgi:hypothetical protein